MAGDNHDLCPACGCFRGMGRRYHFAGCLLLSLCEDCVNEWEMTAWNTPETRRLREARLTYMAWVASIHGTADGTGNDTGELGYGTTRNINDLIAAEDAVAQQLLDWIEAHGPREPAKPDEENERC